MPLFIAADEIVKRLQKWLNNLQCGHKEGQQFPFFCEITIKANPPTYWTQQSGQVQGNISEGRVPVSQAS